MTNKKLLAAFIAEETKDNFRIYGSYEIETGKELDLLTEGVEMIEFKYPKFDCIMATKGIKGREEVYTPGGETWAGRKYTPTDMIEFLLAALIRGDESYTAIDLDDGLQQVINSYTAETETALTVKGRNIPKRMLTHDMYDLYQLLLVTDKYIYYGHDDSIIMLRTEDHTVVSDNCFAESGFLDSVENIKNGKEKLLYGNLPSEE